MVCCRIPIPSSICSKPRGSVVFSLRWVFATLLNLPGFLLLIYNVKRWHGSNTFEVTFHCWKSSFQVDMQINIYSSHFDHRAAYAQSFVCALLAAWLSPSCVIVPDSSQKAAEAFKIISGIPSCHFAIKEHPRPPAAGCTNINDGVTINYTL